MAKEKKTKKRGGVGALLGAVIIVPILLFFGGKGLGFGSGEGLGLGNTDASNQQESQQESVEPSKESDAVANELPAVIIIKIEEDKVYFNEEPCADAESLKALAEAANTDDRVFELEDNNSILATYEWVTGVFKELEIPLGQ